MKTRIIVSAVLLPIFFAVLFIFPAYILAFVMSVICAIGAYELLSATGVSKKKRILVYSMITAVIIPLIVYLGTLIYSSPLTHISLVFSIAFIFICLLVIEAVLAMTSTSVRGKNVARKNNTVTNENKIKSDDEVNNITRTKNDTKTKNTTIANKSSNDNDKDNKFKFYQIPIAICAGVIIPYMLSCLISLKAMPYGHLFVLLPIISAFLTDSGAYFIGVAFGKRKAFPTISPNKTVEGCIGGLITGTLGIVIYGVILENATPLNVVIPALMVYGIIGSIVTEFGDLAFSFIKRKCGIKDYGRLIPGHGGVLDRFDSMTFAAPAMYLLVMTLPAIIIN